VSRCVALPVVAAAAALPRLAALLVERGDVLAHFVEKSDDFARTYVASGTYGFVPGVPSAYTQPLYGFFLVPLYELFGRSWASIGIAQILLAVATALLVYELGRRWVSPRAGLAAALVTTLSPYLVWHDVHVNREIVDQPLAVALLLLALLAAERRSLALAALLGAVAGLAILGNTRLLLLPLLAAAYLAWQVRPLPRALALGAASVAVAAAVVAPWVVRNHVEVGCATVTTDSRALWKANNPQTREILSSGRWIDAVDDLPGTPPTPQDAGGIYEATGRVVRVDECEQMRFYQERVLEFWREQPGEKAVLAAIGAGMLWSPVATPREDRPGAGTWLDLGRTVALPLWTLALYVLALAGARLLPRRLLVVALVLLAYQTLVAMAFVGATRYRVPWDFLLALPAGAALVRGLDYVRARSSARS